MIVNPLHVGAVLDDLDLLDGILRYHAELRIDAWMLHTRQRFIIASIPGSNISEPTAWTFYDSSLSIAHSITS
jgi:hypothetical protein